MTVQPVVALHDALTLGILAGGRASRLAGRDKAWLERQGTPLVLALSAQLAPDVEATLVSANRNLERYLSHGLRVIQDRVVDIGPLGGIEALVAACRTPWLLTVPVDVVNVDDSLVRTLCAAAGTVGAWAEGDDGPQPLIALWRSDALRTACADAIASGRYAIHALQTQMGMTKVRFDGIRFGNLNTPDDLVAAGIEF